MATESGNTKKQKRNIFVRIGSWFKHAALELKKATWPTFSAVMKKLGIVLVVVLFFFILLFGMDILLNFAYDALTSGLSVTSTLSSTVSSVASDTIGAIAGL